MLHSTDFEFRKIVPPIVNRFFEPAKNLFIKIYGCRIDFKPYITPMLCVYILKNCCSLFQSFGYKLYVLFYLGNFVVQGLKSRLLLSFP